MQPGQRSSAKLSLAVSPPATASERREPAIQVSNLSIVFNANRGQLIAVDRVSFDVPHGEFVCIVGPSGCGKSTVLNTIAGLEVPFEGEILAEGLPVHHPRPDVGMVFQQPHLFPWKSVRRNIAHGPRMLGKSAQKANAIADDLIAMVGLKR